MTQVMVKANEGSFSEAQFEILLAEISTLFINLPAERIDDEIETAQRHICEFLGLERSTLWQSQSHQPETMRLTHIYQPKGSRPPVGNMDIKDFFPWVFQKVISGETVTVVKMSDLPGDADRDKESFSLYGAKSGIYIPLSVGQGVVFGVLTFATMHQENNWSKRVVKGCTLLAQVFASALARKKAEVALLESEARLSLATTAAGAGLWNMEIETGTVWVSDKTRELFGFAADQSLDDTSFYNSMWPEDRPRVTSIVEDAILTGEHFSCEFRIVMADGQIRWIVAGGQLDQSLEGDGKRLLGVSLDISAGKSMEAQLEERLHQIEDLKKRLEQENIYLKEEVKLLAENTDIIGKSKAIKKILSKASQVAETDSTVLILGDTGTGKELLARAIHNMSLRKDRPLVTINCASLPPSLIENELFGREKGAYTGAMTKMVGRFELADGSTLFLDEIGELPLDLQSKLLRVIEEGQLERLGSTTPLNIDVRIIAATNRDIEQDVKDGKFRQDLYYRLNVFPILIPPLHERSEDIPILARAFTREFGKKMGKQIEKIPHKTMSALQSYSWPGNVRELRNIIERGMILTKDETLVVELPQSSTIEHSHPVRNLDDIIRREILAVLEQSRWRISGRNGAAEILGLKRSTLHSKMKKLGIQRIDP